MPPPTRQAILDQENGRTVLRPPREGEIEELRRRGLHDRIVSVDEEAFQAGQQETFLERTQGDRPLTTGAESVLNVVTGGASAELVRGLDPTAGALAEQRHERNPGADFVGAAIGSIAPAVAATRGAGALRGLASMTGPGASAGLGLAAEQAIARSLLARGASGIGARTTAGALGATADAAASGAFLALEQSLVTDEPLTAERLLSTAGMSALLGLGLGGTFAGAGAVLGSGRQALARRQAQRLADAGLPESAARIVPGQDEGFLGSTLNRVGMGDSNQMAMASQRAARQIHQEGLDGLNREVRATTESLDSVLRGTDDLIPDAAAVRTRLGQELRNINGQSIRDAVRTTAQAQLRGLESLVESATTSAARQPLSRTRRLLEDLVSGSSTRTPRELLVSLDNTTNTLRSLQPSRDVTGQTLEEVTTAMRNVSTIRETLENLLVDEGVVGPGVANLYSTLRGARTAYQASRAQVLQEFGRAVSEGDGALVQAVDGERLNRVFLEATDARSDRRLAMLNDFLESSRAYRETLAELYPGVPRNDVDALNAAAEEAASSLSRGREASTVITTFERGLTHERGEAGFAIAAGISPAAIGATIGGFAGGAPGAIIGAGLGLVGSAVLRPMSFYASLGRLEGTMRRILGREQQSYGRLRRTLTGRGRAVRSIGRVGSRKVPALVERLRSEEHRRRQYAELVDEVRSLATNPDELITRLETLGGGELAEDFPDLQAELASSAVRGVMYLQSTLPPASIPGPFSHLTDTTPSLSEMDVFIRRFAAIEDPMSIVDRAADLTLTPEEVEAVSVVYPQLYARIQAETTQMIGELESLPPYQARINIGNLLQIPTDESLDPSFVMRMQRRAAQTQNQDRAQFLRSTSRSIDVAGDTYSESQQLALRL